MDRSATKATAKPSSPNLRATRPHAVQAESIAVTSEPSPREAVGSSPSPLPAGRDFQYSLAPLEPSRAPRLYDDAPRLPEGLVDARALVSGAWLELEVGPGRGWFLVERAAAEPRAALLGIEIRRKWAAVVDARLAARGLSTRARVFAEDARDALSRLRPSACMRRVFVNFPDPWWKRRHGKRLLLAPGFLDEVARLLEPGGELFVQTDVEARARGYADLLGSDARFVTGGDSDSSASLAGNPYSARSPRERRAIADGIPIHRMRWVRIGESSPRGSA